MRMKLFGVVAALTGALSAMFATTSAASWWGDSTYEECMVSQMKGQTQMMYGVADKLCKRKFKIETYVPSSDVQYDFSTDGNIARIKVSESGEYIVTRMKARFSGKKCKDTKPEDWGEIRDVKVADNIGRVVLREGKEILAPDEFESCMGGAQFYGTYK